MTNLSWSSTARGYHHYEPGYIVKPRNGSMMLLEMKGAEFDMDHAKYQAARRWVSAVNNWGRLGRWDFMVRRDPLALPGMLAKHDA
jgi:type III restriction enzyme